MSESRYDLQKRKEFLDQEIISLKQILDLLSKCMDKTVKSEYYRRLINVGKIVDDAGLLDSHDENKLYLVLTENRDFIQGRTQKPIVFKDN